VAAVERQAQGRRRARTWRSSVVLLIWWLIVYTAAACEMTVPGQDQPAPPPPNTSTSAQPSNSAVPPAAWIDANAVPLDDSEHWPDLASVAQPFTDGAFEIQSLCQVAPDTRLTAAAVSARARVDRGTNAWSLQQQIAHHAGDRWRMGQLAWALFQDLAKTVTNCEATAPGVHVDITTAESRCGFRPPCSQIAATIDVPVNQVSVHVYLSTVDTTVTELSLWSTQVPTRPWSAPPDAEIFAVMNRRLCNALPCG
jgi:hypothetical protein